MYDLYARLTLSATGAAAVVCITKTSAKCTFGMAFFMIILPFLIFFYTHLLYYMKRS